MSWGEGKVSENTNLYEKFWQVVQESGVSQRVVSKRVVLAEVVWRFTTGTRIQKKELRYQKKERVYKKRNDGTKNRNEGIEKRNEGTFANIGKV